jgi:uncharacterized protein YkwD
MPPTLRYRVPAPNPKQGVPMVDRNTYPHIAPLAPSRGRAMRRLAPIAAALALTLVAFTSVASARTRPCRYAHTSITAASRSQLRSAVLCLVNKKRAAFHLPRLVANQRLNRSAQGWTNEMVAHREFTHGADFASRISATGFDWSNVAENIAAGFKTPSSVVNGWMASTGHCQNILSPIYRMIGTGVSIGGSARGDGRGTWTQDFGLWMGQRPASGNYGPADGCPYR